MKMYKIGTGVGVMILNEKNQLLLGLRNDDEKKADTELHLEGTWTMPGGKIEYGETFEQAGIREVEEETSLKIEERDITPICVQTDKNEYAHFVTIGLLAKKFSGEVKTMEPDEIVEWKWFDLNDLPMNMYFPSKKFLENYLNNRFYTKD